MYVSVYCKYSNDRSVYILLFIVEVLDFFIIRMHKKLLIVSFVICKQIILLFNSTNSNSALLRSSFKIRLFAVSLR